MGPQHLGMCEISLKFHSKSRARNKGVINRNMRVTRSGPTFLAALFGIAVDQSPWQYMLTMKKQGYSGVAKVPLGPFGGDFYFLLEASTVKNVCVDQAEASFPRRYSVPLFPRLGLDHGIVYEQGERHKRQKKMCIPSFERTVSMESFLEAVRGETDALCDALTARARATPDGRLRLDLYREARKLTLRVVLAVTFGLGSEAARGFEKAEELSEVIGAYLEAIVATANEIPPLYDVAPWASLNYRRVTEELLPRLRELVAEVINERRRVEEAAGQSAEGESEGEIGGEIRSSDLLSVLVREPSLTDDDIQSILFDLIIAGSDTTASTLTAAIFLLHEPRHSEALAAAREEANRVDLSRLTLEEVRAKLPYATAISREILRLYPPVPFVGRTSIADAVVEGEPVPRGATLCWSPYFLGRDPGSWGLDADAFDPQRWLNDPTTGGAPSTFCWLPFGAGPRGCLGTRLGLTEAVIGTAVLLQRFDWQFERSELKYKYDLTLNLEGSTRCFVVPRTE